MTWKEYLVVIFVSLSAVVCLFVFFAGVLGFVVCCMCMFSKQQKTTSFE